MKKTVVLGAGGFIGTHLVRRLKREGCYVVGADLKRPDFCDSEADEFVIGDLREYDFVSRVIPDNVDEVYQLAADMGGAGYVFTGDHDADIMYNSAAINLNVAKISVEKQVRALFYASSACIYPEYNQQDPLNPKCGEDTAYPALPDSEYGWEKLFSERLYINFNKNYGLNVKIGRLHNVYGELGVWEGGKEKAPAALCRKIVQADNGDIVAIWGDGEQTRTFLYIDDCLDAISKLIRSSFLGPYNIGSEEIVSINQLAGIIAETAKKEVVFMHEKGPEGVRGRTSDNCFITRDLNWSPGISLREGIEKLYHWVEKMNQRKQESKRE